MSASAVDCLLGLRVTAHEVVHDYGQLVFGDGAAVLTIYNPYEVRGPRLGSDATVEAIVGRRVRAVAERRSVVELRFEGGWSLSVDIREESFEGPEAMVLHRPGESPVVWT
jgi:hypothetical protein